MTRILAIDPGPRSGYALAIDGKITESGTCDGNDISEIGRIITAAQPCVVVVEAEWNKFMLGCMYNWSVSARVLGQETVEANVRSWQAYYGLHRDTKHETKKQYKTRLIEFANYLPDLGKHLDRPIEADEADALLILFWYLANNP